MTDLTWIRTASLHDLMDRAATKRDAACGRVISYSRKVFIPLTKLCRDVCHYCTFAETPRAGKLAYLSQTEVLTIARAGEMAGCTEALFTLGDKPELRYYAARKALSELGYETTISYLRDMCMLVLRETNLLPHVNPGVMTDTEIASLREVTASQGVMLESTSTKLCEAGGVHYGSPDKDPALRLETLRRAGELSVPFTTGILIGIGETLEDRLHTLLTIRDLHEKYGHIQEVIVQNFRAKPLTKAAGTDEPGLQDLCWTIAVARLILPSDVHIQAPPNLSPGVYQLLVAAGLDDWGGISPVTPDHVNPEAAWPELPVLARRTADMGKVLVPRLPVYPKWVGTPDRWLSPPIASRVRQQSDADGWAREDSWAPGMSATPTPQAFLLSKGDPEVEAALRKAVAGKRLAEEEIIRLLSARDVDYRNVIAAANDLRRLVNGELVRYVVNRNINYTNICYYHCRFCAFSKGRTHEALRGAAYNLDLSEIVRRSIEAWDRGATEVCLQGGIHPDYTGATYLNICLAIKKAVPDIHIHAFSPLEVTQGAATLGKPIPEFLAELKAAGLGTLPGTAAEVLDDAVRAMICPDKINSAEWLHVIRSAHQQGIRTTSTIMYGHVEGLSSWARHLLSLRDLQAETGGLTEFVPLPFVHMEAPMFLRGLARRGPTLREAVLMHAIARLVLHPLVTNIQTSWVKMGPKGAAMCLDAGANDLGGTLMNESISRAAGTNHGQEHSPYAMEQLISSIGRTPAQRNTEYRFVSDERRMTSFDAPELTPLKPAPRNRPWSRQRLLA